MSDSNFAERVKRYRKEKGMTQQELADCLGVSNKTVSRWESGDGYPDVALLVPLANALGVTVDDLLNDEKPVRTLTKTDWQNLLSFLFALGGGLLYFLFSGTVPALLCYGVFLGGLCYGAYLQRYYAYHSRWFFGLSLMTALCVNGRFFTQTAIYCNVLRAYGGSLLALFGGNVDLNDLGGFGMGTMGFIGVVAALTLIVTAVMGVLLWRYIRSGEIKRLRLTVGKPSPHSCIPALFPIVYAALMVPRWTETTQKLALVVFLAAAAVVTVLLFRRKGRRRMIAPAAVLLALCPLMGGTVTYLSRSLNTLQWFEGHYDPNYFSIFKRPTWGTALGAAVLAALWLLLCCVHLKEKKPKEIED